MAEFIYKDYACELKFGDLKYELPLNEETAELLENALSDKMLPPKFNGVEDINQFYDNVMDSIDTVLGEGAADDIMSRFKHPGTMEALSVVSYIFGEWRTQYSTAFDDMKQTAHIPNRETRRARARR